LYVVDSTIESANITEINSIGARLDPKWSPNADIVSYVKGRDLLKRIP
jgi:hypothetical protein